MMMPRSVPGAAIVVLGPSALSLARRLKLGLPQAEIHGPVHADVDVSFRSALPHLRALFKTGRPIIGICATGILVRALAPALKDKTNEPPVVALSEDGASAVPYSILRVTGLPASRATVSAFARSGLAIRQPGGGSSRAWPSRASLAVVIAA